MKSGRVQEEFGNKINSWEDSKAVSRILSCLDAGIMAKGGNISYSRIFVRH